MDGTKYEKGGSAGSKGVDYQVSLLTVFLLNALGRLTNWKLSTENKNAGKFDDVVLECTQGDVLLQAKFRENRKRITLDELLSTNSKNDDFSLPKYFLSYQEIKNTFKVKNVIICTNTDIQERVLPFLTTQRVPCESMLYHEHGNLTFYTVNGSILSKLRESARTYSENNLKSKEVDESAFSDENFTDFLNNLQIYANYPPQGDTGKVIEQLLSVVKCSTNLCRQVSPVEINAKVLEWFQRKDGVYLTRTHALAMFSEIQFDKYWQTLDQYNISFQSNDLCFPKSKKILHFSVEGGSLMQELRIFRALQITKVKTLYIVSDDSCEDLQRIVDAFELPNYTFLVITGSRTEDESTLRQSCDKLMELLSKYRHKKVIFLSDLKDKLAQAIKLVITDDYATIGELVTLDDLDGNSRQRLIHKKSILFQGDIVTLTELFGGKLTDITPDMLETLIRGKCVRVGVPVLDLDESINYINRKFKNREGRQFEYFSEDNIYEVARKVILISDSAGMGKSTVLTKLASVIKKKNPHLWVIRIELNDYTGILWEFQKKNKTTMSISELLDYQDSTRLSNAFERLTFASDQKIVFMLDGVDEVSPNYTPLILDILRQCRDSNFAKVFVTARSYMAKELEEYLQEKSFVLEPFESEDQIAFLTSYWMGTLKLDETNREKSKRYAEALLEEMHSWMKDFSIGHFGGIPLHVRMLAEIFQDSNRFDGSVEWSGCKDYLSGDEDVPNLPKKVNITKLYYMFIERKRDIFIDRGNPSGNAAAHKALSEQFEEHLTHHRCLALETILFADKHLFLSYQELGRDAEVNLLKIGLVHKLDDDFHFIHRTFAEYFLAQSILTELQHHNRDAEFQAFVIDEIFSGEWYDVVRRFFDGFLQLDNAVDLLSTNSLSMDYVSEVKDYRKCLAHHLAEEGCVGIFKLVFRCIDFVIIADKEIELREYYKKYDVGKGVVVDTSWNALNSLRDIMRHGGINIKDFSGETPLLLAIGACHLDMVRFLVENGANLNSRGRYGDRPLHKAVMCRENQLEMVKLLVEHGAEIKSENEFSITPMYTGILAGDVPISNYFLESIIQKDGLSFVDPMIPYTAAFLGRLDILQELMKQGMDPNIEESNGGTLILAATKGRQKEAIQYIIEQGGDINRTSSGDTVLTVAAFRGEFDTFKFLLQRGADVKLGGKHGSTALHLAARNGHLDIVKFLVTELQSDVNFRNEKGKTALHYSAKMAHVETMVFLLENGADADIKDNEGNTALHLAASRHALDAIKLLIAECNMDVHLGNDNCSNSLHLAASSGDLETVKFLVTELDMDPNIKDRKGRTALHLAMTYIFHDISHIEFLLAFTSDVNETDDQGQTALFPAAANGSRDAVKLLVDTGADVTVIDNNGHTVLYLAVEYPESYSESFHLKHNFELSSQVRSGYNLLHSPTFWNGWEVIEYLSESGVDVNHRDNIGRTVLHWAASRGQRDTVRLLVLELQADVNVTDRKGRSPLHLAMYHEHLDTAKVLIGELGADINIRDTQGRTVLHLAVDNHLDIVPFLVANGADVRLKDCRGVTAGLLAKWHGSEHLLSYLKVKKRKRFFCMNFPR